MGRMVPSTFVPSGYVKCEGGTVNRANYPRLVALANTYSLWTNDPTNNPGLFGEGDSSTTFVLPNWTSRMAQFASIAGGKVDAGLPNIIGIVSNVWQSLNPSNDGIGAFYYPYKDPYHADTSGGGMSGHDLNFDASRSNIIYGSSTTVQPPAINTFAIMRY